MVDEPPPVEFVSASSSSSSSFSSEYQEERPSSLGSSSPPVFRVVDLSGLAMVNTCDSPDGNSPDGDSPDGDKNCEHTAGSNSLDGKGDSPPDGSSVIVTRAEEDMIQLLVAGTMGRTEPDSCFRRSEEEFRRKNSLSRAENCLQMMFANNLNTFRLRSIRSNAGEQRPGSEAFKLLLMIMVQNIK